MVNNTNSQINKVAIINGIATGGKSTFCELCKEEGAKIQLEVHELSCASLIKNIATQCGWDGNKDVKSRNFLANLKKTIDEWNPTYIVFDVFETMQKIKNNTDKSTLFIVNARSSRDIELLKTMGKRLTGYSVPLVLVANPRVEDNTEAESLISDINSIKYDIKIDNDGNIEDLRTKASAFVLSMCKE